MVTIEILKFNTGYMKIIIAGASGFIGSHLVSFLKEKGHELILLSTRPKPDTHIWNPEQKKIDPSILEGSDVVINLCGENIFGRWTDEKKEKIRKSRLVPVQFLCDTLLTLSSPPSLYIGASAMGYYGDRGDEILTENSPQGTGFLAQLCGEWEAIPQKLQERKIRVVAARFGVVLGKGGGALKSMEGPFRLGLGGKLGTGEQYMSWMAIEDVVEAMHHVIKHPELSGPINFVSPSPVTNLEFTKTLASLVRMPALFSVPEGILKLFLKSAAREAFLSSLRVHPECLLKSGFIFKYPDLLSTLKKYICS